MSKSQIQQVEDPLFRSEICWSWNFWVCVSLQILTKDPLSVLFCNKREILDSRPSASALN